MARLLGLNVSYYLPKKPLQEIPLGGVCYLVNTKNRLQAYSRDHRNEIIWRLLIISNHFSRTPIWARWLATRRVHWSNFYSQCTSIIRRTKPNIFLIKSSKIMRYNAKGYWRTLERNEQRRKIKRAWEPKDTVQQTMKVTQWPRDSYFPPKSIHPELHRCAGNRYSLFARLIRLRHAYFFKTR